MTDAGQERIGISIPFFSRLDYLDAALSSLVAQSDPDWVAVVVDDCSPELGAADVVARFADPRLRYLRNHENLGLARNFNRCLTEPGTEIVAILHADDLLEPNYVELVRSCHTAAPHAACVAPMATVVDDTGAPAGSLVDSVKRLRWPTAQRHVLQGDAGLARLMHTFFIYTPAVSYRPALLPAAPFADRWQQVMDVEVYADLLLSGGAILLDRTPAYRYRRHDGTTTAKNARSFTRVIEESSLCRSIAAQARATGWRRSAFACRLRWSIRANGLVALLASIGRAGRGRGAAIRAIASLR
jgi:glycosyltransferase involved in cell wall biosynthesis